MNRTEPTRTHPFESMNQVDIWVFDLDNTLYPPESDLFGQVNQRIHSYIRDFLGVDQAEADRLKSTYYEAYGSSMRGLMLHHGLEPDEFLAYVHDIELSPLRPNPRMREAILRLGGRRLIFTTASQPYIGRVLERLGLEGLFEEIFDIRSADYRPKPHQATYEAFLKSHDVTPERSVFFEDSARNLPPAAALGMRTCWIKGADESHEAARHHGPFDAVTEDLTGWLEALHDHRTGQAAQG